MTPRGADSPHFRHGLYAQYAPETIQGKVSSFMDADPFDLRDELALNRALLADALSRLGGEDGKERLDGDAIDMLNGIINSIRKLVEAISKIKNDTALTAAEVTYIAVRMVGLLDKYIDDPAKREAFKQELFKFALPEDAALGAGEGFDNL